MSVWLLQREAREREAREREAAPRPLPEPRDRGYADSEKRRAHAERFLAEPVVLVVEPP